MRGGKGLADEPAGIVTRYPQRRPTLLFTLNWLQDPALRRRVSAGLNKGEARNSLARAVFFYRLGEIPQSPAPDTPYSIA
jgi:hypothetical protein